MCRRCWEKDETEKVVVPQSTVAFTLSLPHFQAQSRTLLCQEACLSSMLKDILELSLLTIDCLDAATAKYLTSAWQKCVSNANDSPHSSGREPQASPFVSLLVETKLLQSRFHRPECLARQVILSNRDYCKLTPLTS